MKSKVRKPPEHLSATAKAWFTKTAQEFTFDTEPEWEMLAQAASTFDTITQAQAAIREHGLMVPTGTGSVKPNPAVNVERDAKVVLCRILRELRLLQPAEEVRPPKL